MTPVDQACAHAMFASGGIDSEPFIVELAAQHGHEVYRAKPCTKRVLDKHVCDELTYVLSRANDNLGPLHRARPAACKTGSVQYWNSKNNSAA